MGSGASSSSVQTWDDDSISEAILKLEALKVGAKLNGEETEAIVGKEYFDTNAFSAIALPDLKGNFKVSRDDLLNILRVNRILIHKGVDALSTNVTDKFDPDKLERSLKERNETLFQPPAHEYFAEMRGSLSGLGESQRKHTYRPISPTNADSRTTLYPYSAVGVLILHERSDGGWDLCLFRNHITGEFGIVFTEFGLHHEFKSARPHALKSAVAEALCEQSSGIFHTNVFSNF